MSNQTISKQAKGLPKDAPPSTPAPVVGADAPETAQRSKKIRKPFGSQSQKLARTPRPGFVGYWFNDKPGRIQTALDAGWEFVKDAKGQNDTLPVGVNEAGGALMAFYMETPEEFYQEDMAAQQARVDATDNAIKRGSVGGEPGEDGRYVKRISIHTK